MAPNLSIRSSKEDADTHLRDIRLQHEVDNSDGRGSKISRTLSNALDLLSDQLYQKETHFILELIQNADDNTYEDDVPTIAFHLSRSRGAWQLRIDCNEVGFEKENVEALCAIGESTKKAKQRTRGYIGEKGIGFKSVFKVADVVHISSKAYSFRFDRKDMLGMITPAIEPFPVETHKGQTQILLDLKGKSEFEMINDELGMLERHILIFLRKIAKMVIKTPNQHDQFEAFKVKEDQDLDGKETVTLKTTSLPDNKCTTRKYLIVRRRETSLSPEARRENIKETEIVLAFPVDKNMRPLLRKHQNAYAYLPIDDYGFKYLIQGDFLLVASRESLDASQWNQSILRGVCRAFVRKAVPRFNDFPASESRSLRYTWPLFLKDGGGNYKYWDKLKERIMEQLSNECVLESRHNRTLCQPDSLFYIPHLYRLGRDPLVEDQSSELEHLSFSYDLEIDNILEELKQMGVKVMKFERFYQEFQEKIISKEGRLYLDKKSKRWHSEIARLFVRHGNTSLVANLPLIPLRDGKWVTPSQKHLFLEENTSGAVIPDGIDICLVGAEACEDSKRKAFFEWLGIKKCDQGEACRMIMECYIPFKGRTLEQSVQDLVYLFKARHNFDNNSVEKIQLMMAAPFKPQFSYPKELYIQEPGKTSIVSKYAGNIASNMPVLHPRYLEEIRKIGEESEFVSWACSRLRISTQPRLVDEQDSLTPEFKFLANNATVDLLVVLRDHFDMYSDKLDNRRRPSFRRLTGAVSELKVKCKDKIWRRLDQTVLPGPSMEIRGPHLPFIDVPDPSNSHWRKFSTFGVLVTDSAEFYLRELKALAALPFATTDSMSKTVVQLVYTTLETKIFMEGENATSVRVRLEFEQHPLVFLDRLKRWVFLRDCMWSGPQLSTVHRLSSEYPTSKELFRTYLRLSNVTQDHVIKELLQTTSTTSFDRLQELLLLLNKHLDSKSPKDCLSQLKGKKIIPVRETDGELCRMDYNSDVWYFPDRQNLLDSFSGSLPLIAFEVKIVKKLKPLIQAMALQDYLLSVADTSATKVVGAKIFDERKTLDLRKRVRYFFPLVTEETAESKAHLLTRLSKLNVWGAPSIKISHKIGGVVGAAESGNVLFDSSDDSKLDIYISFNSLNDSRKAMINFELCEEFVRYCSITDSKLEKLVIAILTYPLNEIDGLLEQHGLDVIDEEPHCVVHDTVSDDSDDQNAPVLDTNAVKLASQLIFNQKISISRQTSGVAISDSSSILRNRIPALTQSLLSVKSAASRRSMAPTLVITPSESRLKLGHPSPRTGNSETHVFSSTFRNKPLSAGIEACREQQDVLPEIERGPRVSSDLFDLRDLKSSLPKDVGVEAPHRNSRSSSSFYHSPLRFGHGLRTPKREPDLDSTVYGLYLQHVGLLGETFVNEWLSGQLQHDWDATRHWTSRNRNSLFPNDPFDGREKDFADFTYPDSNGKLTSLLAEHGFIQTPGFWSNNPPTYHLEVKSTTEACAEPFFMSNNQVDKARKYSISWDNDIPPKNVYAIVRVYNLEKETQPGFTIYVDPWAMYLKDELSFLARDNYAVSPNPERS